MESTQRDERIYTDHVFREWLQYRHGTTPDNLPPTLTAELWKQFKQDQNNEALAGNMCTLSVLGEDEEGGRTRKRKVDITFTFEAPLLEARDEIFLCGRDDAKNTVIDYLRGCRSKNKECFDTLSKKFHMLGASGVKGIGKTELQAQICVRWAKEALGEDTKTLYVSYNGGGKAGEYCLSLSGMPNTRDYMDTLGHLLLVSCGMPKKTAREMKIDDAVKYTRKNLGCSSHDTLVICVDEVIELDQYNPQVNGDVQMTMAQKIMSGCMKLQDDSGGKVLFIFTAILDSMFRNLQSLSGRQIQPLPLSMISVNDVFTRLLPQNLKDLASTQPAVHQLILACAGHPRASVDGLPVATKRWTSSQKITTAAIITARNEVIRMCKFALDYLNESILGQWFDVGCSISTELRTNLLNKGILHSVGGDIKDSVGGDVEFLFPLLVQAWAHENQNKSSYGYHLTGLFDADLILDQDTEKFMESVMYHYEAILRKSTAGKKFSLGSFYKTKHIDPKLKHKMVTVDVPRAIELVCFVDDFADAKALLEYLEEGYIVVSEAHSEVGIEYLSPYRDRYNALYVACVQCKFVKESVNWGDIGSKMDKAVTWLKKADISHFPVVYTTADQLSIQKRTYKDGVYLVESDMFAFTSRLGMLRLHTQKLGSALKKKYGFLTVP